VGKAKGNKDIKRDKTGKILPGSGSLNPGGIPRRSLELRALALESAERAVGRLIELIEDDNPLVALEAANSLLRRAVGKEVPASEMPEDVQPLPPGDSSPAALLDRSCKVFERTIARTEAKLAAGSPVSEAEIASIREQAQTLSTLAREQRELAKSGPGADLTDEALVAKVLGAVPYEKLQAALDERAAEMAR
jgi:hypothetical protein